MAKRPTETYAEPIYDVTIVRSYEDTKLVDEELFLLRELAELYSTEQQAKSFVTKLSTLTNVTLNKFQLMRGNK